MTNNKGKKEGSENPIELVRKGASLELTEEIINDRYFDVIRW